MAAAATNAVQFDVYCIRLIEGTPTDLPAGIWEAIHWEFFEHPDYTNPIEDMILDGLSGTLLVSAEADNDLNWMWRETYRWWGPDRPTIFTGRAHTDGGLIRSDVISAVSEFECDWGDCDGPLHGLNRVLLSGDTLVIAHDGPTKYYDVVGPFEAWSRLTLVRKQ